MQKAKLKPLLPSLREKKRYLVYEIIAKNTLSSYQQVADTINYTALQFLGELGYGNAGVMLLNDQWDSEMQRGIIKVSHLYVEHLRTALMLINSINNEEVIVRTVGISGILKKAKRKYLKKKRGDY